MFDEPTSAGGGQPPQNLPVDDMFSGVDTQAAPSGISMEEKAVSGEMVGGTDALAAGVLKRKAPEPVIRTTAAAQPQPSFNYGGTGATAAPVMGGHMGTYPTKEPVLGRIILFVLSGLVIVGLAVGGWWVYSKFIKQPPAAPNPQTTLPPATTSEPVPVVPTEPVPSAPAVNSTSGISTDIKNDAVLFGESVDTDRDGLDDIREQQVGTSVSVVDTDTDGLGDGEEVLVWKTNPLNPDTDGDSFADGEEVQNGYNPLGAGKLPPGQTSPAATTTSP